MLIQEEANSDIKRLYDYFIKEVDGDPIPFDTWEKISLFLEILGSSGGIYSWPPAKQYSIGKPSWLSYSLQITNPLSNTLFLAKATDDLFSTIAIEAKAPETLKEIIKLPSKKELASKYGKMLLGSVVCAIPFGIVTFLFPLPHCNAKPCVATIVTHAVVANTILHAISWNLILTPNYWYYRLPTLPFEKLLSYITTARLSQQERKTLVIQQLQEEVFQKYRDHIGCLFERGGQLIVDDYLRNLHGEAAGLLRTITTDSSWQTFVNHISKYQKDKQGQHSTNCILTTAQSLHNFLQNYPIPLIGAALIIIGCLGLIANPIYIGLMEKLSLPVSISLGALPSYSTAVLCAFYGTAVLGQMYQYLTTWAGDLRSKFSLEARLHPVIFSLFLAFNLYVSAFAYGTAVELIDTIFHSSRWDAIRPSLIYVAIPALQILSFIPLLNLFDIVTRKVSAKFGPDSDDKRAARLLVKTNLFSQRMHQMDGARLMTELSELSDNELEGLGLQKRQVNQDIDTLQKIERSPFGNERRKSYWTSFWKRDVPQERESLLSNADISYNYS